jgi:hypothetical protein
MLGEFSFLHASSKTTASRPGLIFVFRYLFSRHRGKLKEFLSIRSFEDFTASRPDLHFVFRYLFHAIEESSKNINIPFNRCQSGRVLLIL